MIPAAGGRGSSAPARGRLAARDAENAFMTAPPAPASRAHLPHDVPGPAPAPPRPVLPDPEPQPPEIEEPPTPIRPPGPIRDPGRPTPIAALLSSQRP